MLRFAALLPLLGAILTQPRAVVGFAPRVKPRRVEFQRYGLGKVPAPHKTPLPSVFEGRLAPLAAANDESSLSTKEVESVAPAAEEKKGFFKRVLGGMKMDKAKMASLGSAALLTYGAVSNLFMAIMWGLSWYTFSWRNQISPLAPGQFKGFMAVYAGFWVLNNLLRPFRVVLAATLTPFFDAFVLRLENRFGLSKGRAFASVVLIVNVFGTLTVLSLGTLLASILSGVPIWAMG